MILLFPRWDMWSFPGVYFIPLTHLKTISRIEYPKWRTYIYQGASFSRWWQLKYFFIFHPFVWGDDQIWGIFFFRWLGSTAKSVNFRGCEACQRKNFLPNELPRPGFGLFLGGIFGGSGKARRWWKNIWRKKMQQKKASNLEAMDLSFGIFGIFDF